jgi:hypothetical protein
MVIPSLEHNDPRTSLHDIETVYIRGFFTRDPSQSRIIYSCSFTEEGNLSVFSKPMSKPESDTRNDGGRTEYNETPSSPKGSTVTQLKARWS